MARILTPAKILAREPLRALAAAHGVTRETRVSDWGITEQAQVTPLVVAEDQLVDVKPLKDAAELAPLPPSQIADLARYREQIRELNSVASAAQVRGCRFPAFKRSFRHDLRLGGRMFAVGAGHFQSMREEDREAITIGGEPVVELDIGSSFLTIFLALTGTTTLPPGDLYAVGGLPRKVVKGYLTKSMGAGYLLRKWPDKASAAELAVPVKAISAALKAAYPAFLSPMTTILPEDLKARLDKKDHEWAVGQYLTFRESQVIAGVAWNLTGLGRACLPMHDAIIVPERHAASTEADLKRAFRALVGIVPRITGGTTDR